MKERTSFNGGKWTPARYRTFITSALRSAFRRWPPKSEVLKRAVSGTMKHPRINRIVKSYRCSICGYNTFTYTQMQVDHKHPVVDPRKGFEGWDKFIARLFCEGPFLQAVCKPCHKRKSDEERRLRVKQRRAAKKRAETIARRSSRGSGKAST